MPIPPLPTFLHSILASHAPSPSKAIMRDSCINSCKRCAPRRPARTMSTLRIRKYPKCLKRHLGYAQPFFRTSLNLYNDSCPTRHRRKSALAIALSNLAALSHSLTAEAPSAAAALARLSPGEVVQEPSRLPATLGCHLFVTGRTASKQWERRSEQTLLRRI